ncbi:hypothetical protein AYK26_05010 [Euryarchaeota archaeon SM23-78]|nr:MAG: hypothetical protein AYK26_05010 [Euryarchaeota archaeon SM23-78]
MAKGGCEISPFVAIPAVLGGIFLVIVVLFIIFTPSGVRTLASIVWAFTVLGVASGFFAFMGKIRKK